jgi:hypothetical protein
VGSVSGRLSRARDLLRARLTRRGLGVPTVLLTAVAAPTNAMSAASALAAGSVVASPAVSSLAEGVLSAMRIAKLKLTAAIVAATTLVAVAGIGTGYALTRPGPPEVTPLPLEVPVNVVQVDTPIEGDWTPKKATDPVPSAFPDLKLLERAKGGGASLDPIEVAAINRAIAQACPRLFDPNAPSIDMGDNNYRRLLKARLHQGVLEYTHFKSKLEVGSLQLSELAWLLACLNDMRAVTMELWGNDPKELVSRMEEFVILAKVWERYLEVRVQAGADPSYAMAIAHRHRLEAEAALWKAKNPQRQGGK